MALQHILIVNPFGIGDVLFSTPLVRAVRHAFPHASIAYLCNRRTQEILQRNPQVDELFIYEKDELMELWSRSKRLGVAALARLLWRLKRRRFDIVIDLSLGERYSFILAMLGAPRRIGFDFRRRGRFLTHRFEMDGYHNQHVVQYYAQLMNMIGIRLVDEQLELVADPVDQEEAATRLSVHRDGHRLIGLVPAGGISWGLQAHFRRWSKEGFIRVGRVLVERHGVRVLVFGERSDHEICAEIAAAIGSAAMDLSGETTLSQFVSLVRLCDLVISNDGGPIHIAASQGVKTVSIFGPVDPEVYGPYPRTAGHQIVYHRALTCRPCYHHFKLPSCPYERACLTQVEPADVLEACERVLGDADAVTSESCASRPVCG